MNGSRHFSKMALIFARSALSGQSWAFGRIAIGGSVSDLRGLIRAAASSAVLCAACLAAPSPGVAAEAAGAAAPPAKAKAFTQEGMASFYSHRGRNASGGRSDPNSLTAAHRHLPFGSRVVVTNLKSGKQVTVTVNDRGPFRKGRIIDLSREAAKQLGIKGVARVRIVAAD
jgi:rare lipoprotein A